ncbi:Detected protein of unknown function [Hibiscus syriacus]|uniref:Kinesin-like protein n=1 Tax=Hibiscus syriacus TaxID=106335 RepID=A0A6A3AWE4_HIBSY|nr:Detected protein of unknown function [Hibiscus syriacus]
MTGITEYAMADIYDYIQRQKEREFILKFSAMEIYNELVRDFISVEDIYFDRGGRLSINSPKKLCGTEITLRSFYLFVKAVESSAPEFLGNDRSSTLVASVNFVDLAGSERASQTSSAGARLKEGCHINNSLVMLGTVIRKLRLGKSGHIPYRDSKLTQILQSSLGGNSRTAIICTMSPARTHVEQSRNTLLFASCAKEVTTNVQVNLVLSDKALVKQMLREMARLENELKIARTKPTSLISDALLREKDLEIEKLKTDVAILIQQRDLAWSVVEGIRQAANNGSPRDEKPVKEDNNDENSEAPCKEVRCIDPNSRVIEVDNEDTSKQESKSLRFTRSRSCKASLMTVSQWIEKVQENHGVSPVQNAKDFTGRPYTFHRKSSALKFDHQSEAEEFIRNISRNSSICATVNELNAATNATPETYGSSSAWPSEFKRLQREIIELWHDCNVSLVHRTYFFLLFKGDPNDYIYMEVEHRRLSFMKNALTNGHKAVDNGRVLTCASSEKALRREWQMLCQRVSKKLSKVEIENLFRKWGIRLNAKQRRLKLVNLLWTDCNDMEHIAESAAIVAKLAGFENWRRRSRKCLVLTLHWEGQHTPMRQYFETQCIVDAIGVNYIYTS